MALKSDFIQIFDIMFPISMNRYIPNVYISISIYFLCLQLLPVSNFVIHIYKIYIPKYMKYIYKYMKQEMVIHPYTKFSRYSWELTLVVNMMKTLLSTEISCKNGWTDETLHDRSLNFVRLNPTSNECLTYTNCPGSTPFSFSSVFIYICTDKYLRN